MDPTSYEFWRDNPISSASASSSSPAKPGGGLMGTLMGIGAIGEGIGNIIGAYREGSDYRPQRFAMDALKEYMNQGKKDPLEQILEKVLATRGGSFTYTPKKDPNEVSFSSIVTQ